MSKKRLAVIGNGTAGMLSAMHFNKWAENCEIELYYDPKIKPQSVGEGSTIALPSDLNKCLGFLHDDLSQIDGTVKTGVKKIGWTENNCNFLHSFIPPVISYHFNAVKLQKFLLEKLKNDIKIIESNVSADDIDCDFVMDCSGTPSNFDDYNYSKYMVVNSVYVTQCYWDFSRFQHTLAIARPYGWVFGIPLTNRCSIGYLYNKDINTLDEVKEDVKQIFEDYNLTPSEDTNNFSFKNYYKKQNFTKRISYNGNASFFLEPMEATSIVTMAAVYRGAYDVWFGGKNYNYLNDSYTNFLSSTETMIMLHYYSKSIYKTDFWDYAYERAENCMIESFKKRGFKKLLENVKNGINFSGGEIGTWPVDSYRQNMTNLNILDKLIGLSNNEKFK